MAKNRNDVISKVYWCATTVALMCFPIRYASASSCEDLKSLKLPNTSIDIAEVVKAGAFKAPATEAPQGGAPPAADNARDANVRTAATFAKLPAFCRVSGSIRPTPDSNIKFEVWMPTDNWNQRFEEVGSGGFAGSIIYRSMAEALDSGYATTNTDTGHGSEPNGEAAWGGHPEKVVDFGYRAVHETTVKAKSIISAFYGSGPKFSYWNGCSEGGRQGMTEAERFPNDFNGIIAGDPVFDFTHGQTRGIWNNIQVYKEPDSYLTPVDYALIHHAVLDQCDEADGVKDGVVNNPEQCHFNPSILLCKEGKTPGCLSAAQVLGITAQLSPLVDSQTHRVITNGQMPGFEVFHMTRPDPAPDKLKSVKISPFYAYFVFNDPDWDWTTFDLQRDLPIADKKFAKTLNSYDPDLKAFKAAGGKLISYHGWADFGPSPLNTLDYFKKVQTVVGESSAFYRLFMIPGMGHCAGGPGTDQFDKMAAITGWVEHGTAPNSLIASHLTKGKVDRTRPLCAYPEIAKYKGTGSTDDAANFMCGKP